MTRDAWLPMLQQIETVHARFGAGLSPESVRSLVSAGCQTVQDLWKVDRTTVEAEAAQTVALIQQPLRDSLGAGSERTISDAVGLVALARAGCRTKADVVALRRDAIDSLPEAAPQEVMQYLVGLLRESLGGSERMLSFATQLSLVRAGCRTKSDVDHASPATVAALPGKAPHEVAEYLLREPLGKSSECVLSSVTLLALLQAGCKTQADVAALKPEAVEALPGAASRYVTQYLSLIHI